MDNILDVILPPSAAARRRSTPTIAVADFRLCRTLGEIRGRLDRLNAGGPPTFVYSLPQDVHVPRSSLARARTPVDGASYGTFYAPYASRVRRLDACFGEFIDDLKARGLFEQQRHRRDRRSRRLARRAGTDGARVHDLPEILQVPLIVHLPSGLGAGLGADTSAPAFTTDLTPTLYALLGHQPRPPAAVLRAVRCSARRRRSATAAIRRTRRSSRRAMEASTAPCWMTLAVCTSSMGSAFASTRTTLDGTGAGRVETVSDTDRVRGQRAIRATVEGIARAVWLSSIADLS